MAQLDIGDILEDRYRIDHPIARGGMSTVYRCVDLRLGREVAAKVMDQRYIGDPVFRQRFRREARAMAQLSHPNLVSVYDFSSDDANAFLIMELITGGTLRELVAERGPMPPHAAAAVMKPVLTGLAEAHRRGMVHRDIKPDNILINGDHQVKLADFGLVRAASGATATSHSIVGTVSYLSPEQVDGSEISPASDVYSAGIVLFELLTGTTPFEGETDLSHALQRLNHDVDSPSERINGVPPLIDQLVASATMRDPKQRFHTAGEFLEALEDVSAELNLPDYTVPVPQNSAAHRATAIPTNMEGILGQSDPNLEDATSVIDAPPVPIDNPQTQVLPAQQAPLEDDTHAIVPAQPEALDNAPVPQDKPKPITNRKRWPLIIALIVVAALTAAVALGGWWFGSGRYGQVPQIIGMDRSTAVAEIQEAGFTPVTELVYDNAIPNDHSVGTDPPQGSKVLPGNTVTVLISQGRPTVPEALAGMGIEDYRALAQQRSLNVTTGESVFSNTVPSGAVAQTRPPAGTAVNVGSTITVQLSQGPKPAKVPDVIGMPLEEVERMLEELDLNIDEITETFDADVDGGSVASINPGPGTNLEAGDSVSLEVSRALTVPDLSGVSIDDAREQLEDAGFEVSVSAKDEATGTSFDTVIDSSPAAGARLDPEDDPELTLYRPEYIKAPNLIGLSLAQAEQAAENAGLRTRGALFSDSEQVVTQQTPAPGELVSARERIRLSTN